MKFLRADEAGDDDNGATIRPLVHMPPPTNGASNGRHARHATAEALPQMPPDFEHVRAGLPSVRPEVLDACLVALRRMGGPNLRSVGVTSSGKGEGRSTVATAMAVIQASEYQRKTILVELDAHRPSAARELSLAEGPGVAEYLRDGVDLERCIQWPTENLGVMVAGKNASMAQVLRGNVADDLVAVLSRRADMVVLDLPPLSKGDGGVQLVDLCEAVALVVRAGEVSTHRIEEAAAALNSPPFVILNGVKSAAPTWVRRLLGMR